MPLTLPATAPLKAMHRFALRDDERAPSELRHWIRKRLTEREVELVGDDLAVVASELASNAVVHGRAPAYASLIKAEALGEVCVRLEIGDSGSGFDPARISVDQAPDLPSGGRGLLIVAALSRTWGWRRVDHGHLVWAELGAG
ncbi:ATP-binding protein [Streptomyces sp. NPDC004779]